jgi:Predicted metal-dependent membrane protease
MLCIVDLLPVANCRLELIIKLDNEVRYCAIFENQASTGRTLDERLQPDCNSTPLNNCTLVNSVSDYPRGSDNPSKKGCRRIRLEKTKMNTSRKPWLTSLGIFTIWLIIVVGGGLLQVRGQPTQLEELVKSQLVFGVLGAVIFLSGTITYLKWWNKVGWKGPNSSRNLRLLWLPALFLFLMLVIVLFSGLPSTPILLIVIVNTLMVGISEELMFRGVLFHGASSSFGIWRAVWITAIVFGLVHTLNSLITGDFKASAVQAFFAGMFGVWAVALRIRLDTVIPLIIIHWLWDCMAFLTSSSQGLLLLPFSFILFFYGIWLLRSYRHGKIYLEG